MSDATQVKSIAAALQAAQDEIATRWLERIAARVAVDRHFVFPSEDILDEIPLLISAIARHIEDVSGEIVVNTPAVEKARELGRLRHAQGFSARQILWEYEVLGQVILSFVDGLEDWAVGPGVPQLAVRRLFSALAAVQRATVEEFLDHYDDRVHEREDRLRSFSRALSHELKTELGAVLGAARMLGEDFVRTDPLLRDRFISMVLENGERMGRLVENLRELAAIDLDARQNRNVLLPNAVAEVARQLRAYAESQAVRIELAGDMPPLEVNAAAVELCLTNLVANGIKYHDPGRTDRWVRIQVRALADPARRIAVEVRDNGRGVPDGDRPRLFERFFRSANVTDVEGSGLGLSLVYEAVQRLGGEVWADFPEGGGTAFTFTLPARRDDDPVD